MFFSSRPAGRDGANSAGAAPGFCEWVSSWEKTTHAPCGVSLLAAAELQQLLHLSSCPYFFGVSPSLALALILAAKAGLHAPCKTSSAEMRGGVCANNIN